jgi:hypothetical protein
MSRDSLPPNWLPAPMITIFAAVIKGTLSSAQPEFTSIQKRFKRTSASLILSVAVA